MVVQDVRDQFRENAGIMAGTSKPNYARCVNIVTSAALKEMVVPGLLAVGLPVVVGLIFKHFSQSYQANASMDSVGGSLVPMIAGKAVKPCRGGGGCRAADGRNDLRRAAGHADEQRRRRMGQRQEVHRDGVSMVARSPTRTRAAVVGDTVGDTRSKTPPARACMC